MLYELFDTAFDALIPPEALFDKRLLIYDEDLTTKISVEKFDDSSLINRNLWHILRPVIKLSRRLCCPLRPVS